jgi:membrane protein DedA with SNARE-associated domain
MSARKYLLLDLLAASVWATAFSLLGYSAGEMMDSLTKDLHRYEMWLAIGVAAIGVAVLVWRWVSARRGRRDPET